MLYKAEFKDGKLSMEKAIGYANADGSLTIQTCGVYQRQLAFDGDTFEGAVYATTEEKAVEALQATVSVELALARAEVARLEDLLTEITAGASEFVA